MNQESLHWRLRSSCLTLLFLVFFFPLSIFHYLFKSEELLATILTQISLILVTMQPTVALYWYYLEQPWYSSSSFPFQHLEPVILLLLLGWWVEALRTRAICIRYQYNIMQLYVNCETEVFCSGIFNIWTKWHHISLLLELNLKQFYK